MDGTSCCCEENSTAVRNTVLLLSLRIGCLSLVRDWLHDRCVWTQTRNLWRMALRLGNLATFCPLQKRYACAWHATGCEQFQYGCAHDLCLLASKGDVSLAHATENQNLILVLYDRYQDFYWRKYIVYPGLLELFYSLRKSIHIRCCRTRYCIYCRCILCMQCT